MIWIDGNCAMKANGFTKEITVLQYERFVAGCTFSIQCNIILRKKYFMKELHESEYLSKHFQVQLFGPPFHPHLFLYRNQYIWKMINTLTLFT